jgi:hypothetical protein
MQVFLGIIAAISPVLALVGVWLGARLSDLQEGGRWLRDQRQQIYVEYLDLLTALIRSFGVGMRVSKFGGQAAVEAGHNFRGVEDAFHDSLDELHHIELRLELVMGDDVREAKQRMDGFIANIFEATDSNDITNDRWNEIQEDGWDSLDELQRSMRSELGVKSTRRNGRNRRLQLTN